MGKRKKKENIINLCLRNKSKKKNMKILPTLVLEIMKRKKKKEYYQPLLKLKKSEEKKENIINPCLKSKEVKKKRILSTLV